MATGSGLDAQFGVKTETTVGTIETVATFFQFNSAGLTLEPSYIENKGIKAGRTSIGVSQAGIARKSASGKGEFPLMMKRMGWWFKHMIGSTANPVLDTATAYTQVHIPAGLRGKSFTAQIGKPEPGTGTVQPLNYRGCKITDWSITFADNETTMLSVSFDGWDEATTPALVAASYATSDQAFNFSHVTSFKTGATTVVTWDTTPAEMKWTGGTAVPSVSTKFTLSGKNSLATDRFGLGNAGVKKEQLEIDFTEMTGSLEAEYDEATWATPLRAGTTTAIQITSQGADIETGKPYLFDIIIPAAKITKAPAEVSGPGLVTVSAEFKVYDPEVTNLSAVQFKIRSTDTAAW